VSQQQEEERPLLPPSFSTHDALKAAAPHEARGRFKLALQWLLRFCVKHLMESWPSALEAAWHIFVYSF